VLTMIREEFAIVRKEFNNIRKLDRSPLPKSLLEFLERAKALRKLASAAHRLLAVGLLQIKRIVSLIDVRDDYRRVFLIIPWAVLVTVHLVFGIPLIGLFFVHIHFSIFRRLLHYAAAVFCTWIGIMGQKAKKAVWSDAEYFNFNNVYQFDRHAQLRRFVASRNVFAILMLVPFLLDCLLFFVVSSIVVGLLVAGYFSTFAYRIIALTAWCASFILSIVVTILWFIYLADLMALDLFPRFKFGPQNISEFQFSCCQCLTQRDCRAEFGVDMSFHREACHQCKERDKQWIWIECGYVIGQDANWKRVARESIWNPDHMV
jgi:hypothetical protein